MRFPRSLGSLVVCAALTASCTQAEQPGGSGAPTAVSVSPSAEVSASPSAATPSPTTSEPRLTWQRSLAFAAEAVVTDADGNAYVTGFVPVGPATDVGRSVAMVLERSGPDGEPAWTRRWRSKDEMFSDAAGSDVTVSPDGRVVYVAGEIMIPPWENRRVRLWAYSADGDLLWSRQTDGYAFGAAVGATATDVVVGGSGWLSAWSTDGEPRWSEPFVEPSGPHCDLVSDVAVGDGDRLYVVGSLDRTPTCGEMEGGAFEDADVVIQQRSGSGELVWSRILTDPGADNDWGRAIDVIGDEVYVAGEQDDRPWLARMSARGDIVWARRWGAPGSVVWTAGVSAATWGAVYVLADRGPLVLQRYTPEGDLEWDRRERVEPVAEGVATAPDGVLYVVAGDFSETGELMRMRP